MRKFVCITILALSCLSAFAQKADLRRGNREFKKKEYAKADISYRKAIMQDTSLVAAYYNLANNLYRQENYDEAARQLDAVQLTASEEAFAADYYFNRGDVAIAKEDWQTAVNMFKECLRRSPGDLEAKENYLYARNKLQEQQQNQDQNQQNQDQNQDDQQQQQPPREQKISPQQAQQMLNAMLAKERETQDKVNQEKAQASPDKKEKNW